MSGGRDTFSDRASRRLDQWLWFARFAKSRALAARLCAASAVSINGIAATKPNHT
ncbi:MAG: S4 domain-containing protein, partial [Stellaceae bacterium]